MNNGPFKQGARYAFSPAVKSRTGLLIPEAEYRYSVPPCPNKEPVYMHFFYTRGGYGTFVPETAFAETVITEL